MHSFYFRPGRNAATAVISGATALWSGWLWWDDGSILWLLSSLLVGPAAVKGALNALNSEPALKFDNERLWVRTMFGTRAIAWSQIYGIALQIRMIRHLGIIPIGRREILCIACEGGSLGAKRLRVPANTIELPAGGAKELVQILRNAQLAAVGTVGRDVPTEGGFDADAAIARYLASKEAEQKAPAPNPAPVVPQRPVFGRRQA